MTGRNTRTGTARRGPSQVRGPGLQYKQPSNEWMNGPELVLKLRGVSLNESTYNLWRHFQKEGNIVLIEIFEGQDGRRQGTGLLKFCPPPTTPFWQHNQGNYLITRQDSQVSYFINIRLEERRAFKIQSPINKSFYYDPKMILYPSYLHFGLMVDPKSMMPQHTIQAPIRNKDKLTFTVDLKRNQIVAAFNVTFQDPRSRGDGNYKSDAKVGKFDRENRYMFQIPFSQLAKIGRVNTGDGQFSLVISLDSPPSYFRKRSDDKAGHGHENLFWSEFDTWYRQTDVVYDPYRLQTAKIALHNEKPVIDIGRWTTYVFTFQEGEETKTFDLLQRALQDFNIEIVTLPELAKVPGHAAELWSLIDLSEMSQTSTQMQHLIGNDQTFYLPFEVRYQLEVCISREILNEYNIDRHFVRKLADLASEDATKARNILEYIAGQEKRIYNPMSIFDDLEALAFSAKTEIPHYCAYSRKATITPSTIYFSSPTVETTNRVLRHYSRENLEGRFLRVQFTDEFSEGRISACADKDRNDELFTRVYRTLFNGIQIGDRHYEFLAFGNSQFRENGAYFFCPNANLSCADIRHWMGNFSDIKVVAKYAARLGQCFSTTRAINGLSKPEIVLINDVEKDNGRGGKYCFTDGVGKISPFLAKMIAVELGIRSNIAPSAFQFRLGGCKGILVVWPDAKDRQVHIRKSQQKFTAIYNGLEIVRCSRFSCATLNRQTITILSSLGVPDEVFLKMLSEQLANYQTAMSNDDLAVSLLLRYIDENQMTINIATMIRNGFMAEKDPFVLSLLHLWRSWSIKLLKEKAKIIVEDGAFVLGCIDETDTLRGYTMPTVAPGEQFTEDELPQIFLQVPDKKDPTQYNVIEGICLVGRNPSLHPGDLRVVQAINVPALHHLRDLVVFPRTGERDIPSMCSGGDLDGDDFFVIWDKHLRPPEWNCEPMTYDAPKPKNHSRPIEVTDLMKFFVRFMKNDSLPTIAHAHLAQSDYLDNSVKDSKCLELSQLHSKAVDYVKSGEPAQMPKRLRPRMWPHFMEKKHKPKTQQYHSRKILGQLYDQVEIVNFVPQYEEKFDKRILKAYTFNDTLLKTIRQIKSKYDTAMKRLMAQQEIATEFEIWSTFVLSRPRVGSDYKVQEEIARLSDALKDQFRSVCIEAAGSKEFTVLGPFVAGMYKITKEEMDIALAECRTTKVVSGQQVPKRKMEPKYMPLISFPWLFEKELGRIATGINTLDEPEDMGRNNLAFPNASGHFRKRQGASQAYTEDYVQREDGVLVHRGEELDLFRDDCDSESSSGESDYLDVRREDYAFMERDANDAAIATEFKSGNPPTPAQYLSGTGVEDVVPRTQLDGFISPEESARLAREAGDGPFINTNNWQDGKHAKQKYERAAKEILSDEVEHSDSSQSNPSPQNEIHSQLLTPPDCSDQESLIEEEEEVNTVLESSMEKVLRIVGSDNLVAGASSRLNEVETVEEEEVMAVQPRESPLEKLAALMNS